MPQNAATKEPPDSTTPTKVVATLFFAVVVGFTQYWLWRSLLRVPDPSAEIVAICIAVVAAARELVSASIEHRRRTSLIAITLAAWLLFTTSLCFYYASPLLAIPLVLFLIGLIDLAGRIASAPAQLPQAEPVPIHPPPESGHATTLRLLRRSYSGVWGAKVFWLAALTILPLLLRFKLPGVGLVVSPATFVYAVYHGIGLYLWMNVRILGDPDMFDHYEQVTETRKLSKLARWHGRLGWIVLSLLLVTAVAKLRLEFGPQQVAVPLPTYVRYLLGLSKPDDVTASENRSDPGGLTAHPTPDAAVEARSLPEPDDPMVKLLQQLVGVEEGQVLLGSMIGMRCSNGSELPDDPSDPEAGPTFDEVKGEVLDLTAQVTKLVDSNGLSELGRTQPLTYRALVHAMSERKRRLQTLHPGSALCTSEAATAYETLHLELKQVLVEYASFLTKPTTVRAPIATPRPPAPFAPAAIAQARAQHRWAYADSISREVIVGSCSNNDTAILLCDAAHVGDMIFKGDEIELKRFDQPPAQGHTVVLSDDRSRATVTGKASCGGDRRVTMNVAVYKCEPIAR